MTKSYHNKTPDLFASFSNFLHNFAPENNNQHKLRNIHLGEYVGNTLSFFYS